MIILSCAIFFIFLPRDGFQSTVGTRCTKNSDCLSHACRNGWCFDSISSFEKYPIGENCPTGSVVVTVEECMTASSVLEFQYFGKQEDYNKHHMPAGCFWMQDATGSYQSYFNKIVDPSQTWPDAFRGRGGVCVKDGYTHILGLYCKGKSISSYTTLQTAKAACDNNIECDCIYEQGCNGDRWHTIKSNEFIYSADGDCTWNRRCIRDESCRNSWIRCNGVCAPPPSTCFTVGGNIIGRECKFPFIYNKWNDYPYVPASFLRWFPNEIKFESCTDYGNSGRLWCATKVTSDDRYIPGNWGECINSPICMYGKDYAEPCVGDCKYHREMT